MNRSEAVEAFYTSRKYRKCKKEYAKSVGNLCERCLKRGIINSGTKKQPLENHHKIPLNDDNINDPSITLNWDNFELLCKKCHDEERERKPKRWFLTADGKIAVGDPP